jgi:hypothetical protein
LFVNWQLRSLAESSTKKRYGGVFGHHAAILTMDFTMRLLVIEKKTAAQYDSSLANGATDPRQHSTEIDRGESNDEETNEEDILLPKAEQEEFKIPERQNRLVCSLPILYYLSDPRLLHGSFGCFCPGHTSCDVRCHSPHRSTIDVWLLISRCWFSIFRS